LDDRVDGKDEKRNRNRARPFVAPSEARLARVFLSDEVGDEQKKESNAYIDVYI
jgi:hypothetical protein